MDDETTPPSSGNSRYENIRQWFRENGTLSKEDRRVRALHREVVAFCTLLHLPAFPHQHPLLPQELVAYFCAHLCKCCGATGLVDDMRSMPFSNLIDSAFEKSDWSWNKESSQVLEEAWEALWLVLAKPSPHGAAWSEVTLEHHLHHEPSPKADREHQRRLVNTWIDKVDRRVFDLLLPGPQGIRIERKSELKIARRRQYLQAQIGAADACPVTVLAWAMVFVLRKCKRKNVDNLGFLTRAQAVEELRQGLSVYGERLTSPQETWLLAGAPGEKLAEAAAKCEFSLAVLVEKENNRERRRHC